jgi:NADH-quinone oxidoreductase subunit I
VRSVRTSTHTAHYLFVASAPHVPHGQGAVRTVWYHALMIRPFLIGFATTFKHMFRKANTVNYPAEKIPVFPKYRGKQVLMRDENGLEKCVACGLCAVACPADAIYLEPAENDGTVQAGPRYASIYQIHKTRCIFCGYCEEACPVAAIFMGKDYELAVYSNKDFIWDKEDLLVPAATTPAPAGR